MKQIKLTRHQVLGDHRVFLRLSDEHGLETLVDERLSSCFDALENEPLNVADLERPCAIGGFSVAARL